MEKGIKVIEIERYGKPKTVLVHEFAPNQKAAMAAEMITKWGFSSACPDGEDSSGRSKGRNFTPEEIVDRACECAEKAFSEFERRGWLVELPESMAE